MSNIRFIELYSNPQLILYPKCINIVKIERWHVVDHHIDETEDTPMSSNVIILTNRQEYDGFISPETHTELLRLSI